MVANPGDVQAQLDRHRRLFEATPVPLFVLDAAGIVLHANHRARHTVGRSAAAVDGMPFSELIDPAWRSATEARLRETRAASRARTADTGLLTADGKTLFARLEATPIEDVHGPIVLVAVLVLTEDTANLHLVGDTFDTTRDRVRAPSAKYDRT